MEISVQGVELDEAVRARIAEAVGAFKLLEELVRWGYAQTPRRPIADVVVQDEYTHDVVIRFDDRLVLVFDST